MNNSATINTICKPLVLFLIFEVTLITYHLTQSQMRLAGVNAIMTLIGAILIYLLCAGGFETAAWLLLAIVPFFFVALIAFLIVSQFVKTKVKLDNTNYMDDSVNYKESDELSTENLPESEETCTNE